MSSVDRIGSDAADGVDTPARWKVASPGTSTRSAEDSAPAEVSPLGPRHAEATGLLQTIPWLDGGLHALEQALKARDEHTWRHSMRVADLAGLLAFELGWPTERVGLLHAAGLMHDIGKIALPDRLLKAHRPFNLTPGDRQLLMAHPVAGAEITARVLTVEQLAWVRHHHERWDGLGYPERLRGHDIPDGARLLALAEAWDAMTAGPSREALDDPRRGAQRLPVRGGGPVHPQRRRRPHTHHRRETTRPKPAVMRQHIGGRRSAASGGTRASAAKNVWTICRLSWAAQRSLARTSIEPANTRTAAEETNASLDLLV